MSSFTIKCDKIYNAQSTKYRRTCNYLPVLRALDLGVPYVEKWKGATIRSVSTTFLTKRKIELRHNSTTRISIKCKFLLECLSIHKKSAWGGIHPRWFILSKPESRVQCVRIKHSKSSNVPFFQNNTSIELFA